MSEHLQYVMVMMPLLLRSTLATLNLPGAKLLLLQLMNTLPIYMQTVAVTLRNMTEMALLVPPALVRWPVTAKAPWQRVIRPPLGTPGLVGPLRLLYGHRTPMHPPPTNFVTRRRLGIRTCLKVELLKPLSMKGLLPNLTLDVRMILISYLLLRSRSRLDYLPARGLRVQYPRLERVGTWPILNMAELVS